MLLKMKAGPLSDPIMEGSPSLGMSLSMIFLITMDAVSFLMGKASMQPEKVSTKLGCIYTHICQVLPQCSPPLSFLLLRAPSYVG